MRCGEFKDLKRNAFDEASHTHILNAGTRLKLETERAAKLEAERAKLGAERAAKIEAERNKFEAERAAKLASSKN